MSGTFAAAACVCALGLAPKAPAGRVVSERFRQLTRSAEWRSAGTQPLAFDTFHPQGLVKIGETFYLSSVDVTTPPRRYPQPVDGHDRSPGEGRGHLFKFDAGGHLLADLLLGEGTVYHPGGIDFDGQFIWAPVSEYRPDSRAIVYRVDPAAMTATEVLRYPDHIGGIVHDRDDHVLHGVTWGSRRFLRWPLDERGRARPALPARRNGSFYVDYQDCKSLGRREMLCAGVSSYRRVDSQPALALGGMELVDLGTGRQVHQLPVELWTASGVPMTQNPFWIEPNEQAGLRVYVVPEDNTSTLYTFDVSQGAAR